MIAAMGAVSTFAAAERWRRTSDRFVLAARALADDETLAVPRARLLGSAAELRLKGYLHATRGGAPETRDLSRLISLAMQCGLVLTPAEKACVRQLQAAQAADVTSPVVLPSNQVDGLFAAIDAQCGSGEQGAA